MYQTYRYKIYLPGTFNRTSNIINLNVRPGSSIEPYGKDFNYYLNSFSFTATYDTLNTFFEGYELNEKLLIEKDTVSVNEPVKGLIHVNYKANRATPCDSSLINLKFKTNERLSTDIKIDSFFINSDRIEKIASPVISILPINDTITINDTTNIQVYDTTKITINDTTHIQIYDTTKITINDTTHIQVYDTTKITINDTTHIQVYDTTKITVTDTTYITVTDTLLIDIQTLIDNPNVTGNIRVYPNPAKDRIFIKIPSDADLSGYTVALSNMIGNEFSRQPLYSDVVEINISSLPPGTYLLSFINTLNQIVETRKIIIRN
ncbi:T9SS type A sorting domain-containing protein [Tenuifilum thalassicum]|uniref:T9SS type A sorting domain-containing protein n=1 Tax=Tenuifilum thalassicum TaxID=2590900 RepID=UPI001564626B|nr:T9SS type A sorting domain-containing protein [Tenuifilum thalassicum]